MKLIRGALMPVATFLALPLQLVGQSTAETKSGATVTGTAIYRERIAMQPEAVFEATLEDISNVDSPAEIVANARIENPGNPPYHFALDYDPSRIVENHSYSVRATIKVDGKLIFTSTQSYPVITRGNPQEVNIILRSVAASPQSHAKPAPASAPHPAPQYPLERTDWKLERLGDEAVVDNPDQPEPNLTLNPDDHRISGSGGCNRMMGTYQLDGESLRFGALATTRMACANGMDQEQRFLASLELVRTWKIKGTHLELSSEDGKVVALLEARDTK